MSDILLNQDDTYEIQLASIITSYDEKVLFRLYQPIIGYGPINLFLTLFNELEGERIVSTGVKTHSRLFEIMLINNLKFVKFRKYLEALGLLKTFVLETENVNRYVYKLYAPLAPDKFFTHPILNNLLKRNISIEEYERTKLYFVNKVGVKASYKDVSCNINDVFFNDKDNLGKAGTNGIVDRVFNQNLAAGTYTVHLLITAIAGAQSRSHQHKRCFHWLFPPFLPPCITHSTDDTLVYHNFFSSSTAIGKSIGFSPYLSVFLRRTRRCKKIFHCFWNIGSFLL